MAKVSEMKEMMASLLEAIKGLNDNANKNNEKLCTQLEIVAEKLDSNGLRIDELTRAVGAGRMVQKVQIKGSKTGKKSSGEETVDGKITETYRVFWKQKEITAGRDRITM